ncbi:MAG: hypothetical protein LBK99_06005 [Opitutaceae bacterium]|nr:hypothetical protein [Opitutaceae bacterium]
MFFLFVMGCGTRKRAVRPVLRNRERADFAKEQGMEEVFIDGYFLPYIDGLAPGAGYDKMRHGRNAFGCTVAGWVDNPAWEGGGFIRIGGR